MIPLAEPLIAAGGQRGAPWAPGAFTSEAGDVMLKFFGDDSPIGAGAGMIIT